MELELFIILALIIVFLVSCCGLIQKIRENYDEDRGRVISVTQIHVPNQAYNSAFQNEDELSSGIFPGTLAPPPYTEHIEPPPRYEDLIKESQYTVIQMGPTAEGVPRAVFMNHTETGAVPHPQAVFANQNEARALPYPTEIQTTPPAATAVP